MDINGLLTSTGINIGLCVGLFSLYSVLRKQPSNVNVYFGRRLASRRLRHVDILERFVPSPTWVKKAWETTQDDILTIGGLDAVAFSRMLVFSIRMFSVATVICFVLVLPVNYHGRERLYKNIPLESLEAFTIENVKQGSRWLWAHCLALYIITITACTLLYFEYRHLTDLRLIHIIGPAPNPSQFAILVRGIPWSQESTYCDTVKKFFSYYYESTYLSHQMVYNSGVVQKLKVLHAFKFCRLFSIIYFRDNAKHMCKVLSRSMTRCGHGFSHCCFCGGFKNSIDFAMRYNDIETDSRKESGTAFVYFKTRYAAYVAAQNLQTSHPMLWVTDLAPEPNDVYWSNLCIPYRQIWLRRISTFGAAVTFMIVFIIPVTFAQGLTQLDKLEKMFPFLTRVLTQKFMNQLVTGYLPSVILVLFLLAVPPVMMLLSTMEGHISRSIRKKSACLKVLFFTIWNVFFVNVFAGSVISQLSVFASVSELPAQLAKAVPVQATYFTTYVLSSGWASLACEIMQVCPLFYNLFRRYILRSKDDSEEGTLTFPYHTEVPRVLLFGFLGFTCSILAPLILPFLLFYFSLAYLVYRNQILNVYVTKYDGGGKLWPIAHNSVIFSLIVSQIIALGVFGLKRSTVSSGFIIPLLIGTILFHIYCNQRFHPAFKNLATQVLIDMDRRDQHLGKMEEIYEQVHSFYCQFPTRSASSSERSAGSYRGMTSDHVSPAPETLDADNDGIDINIQRQRDMAWPLGDLV
ncbi:hypothetical protein Ahy_A08g038789 [Arachis hypogaea]|uniref:CSC1/OSCA1-like 7TM region domain-containing protein n=1 Tax=Arachis hypogaea TaxID=3818 RepID=A0A445BUQ4_ARAHY|nr:hypothetical protein Ahy_A08g038789 [Arachis hypogaea]